MADCLILHQIQSHTSLWEFFNKHCELHILLGGTYQHQNRRHSLVFFDQDEVENQMLG